MSDIFKQATLIKAVFSDPKGKELLDMWKEAVRPVFLSDVRSQDILLGKQLHIEEIEYLLNSTADELASMQPSGLFDESEF